VRGRPDEAADTFDRARGACPDGHAAARTLLGTATAYLDRGNLRDAEATFRTALRTNNNPAHATVARIQLALILLLQRRFDQAEQVLEACSPALLSRIRCAAGDLAGAVVAADHAIRRADSDTDPRELAEAHVAAALAEAAFRKLPDARRQRRGPADA